MLWNCVLCIEFGMMLMMMKMMIGGKEEDKRNGRSVWCHCP